MMLGELPTPISFIVDSDGAITASWAHGEQGHPDSWRVTLLWQPKEGFHVFKTDKHGIHNVEGDNAGVWLAAVIDVGWGKDKRVDITEWADSELEYNRCATLELLAEIAASNVFERIGLGDLHRRCVEEIERRAAQRQGNAPKGGT